MSLGLRILDAKTVHDLRETGFTKSLSLNFVAADSSNNIAYFPMHMTPRRSSFYAGTTVSRGWNGENEWDMGMLGEEDSPVVINPEKGYIVTANNKVSSTNVEHNIGTMIPQTSRAKRIAEMID